MFMTMCVAHCVCVNAMWMFVHTSIWICTFCTVCLCVCVGGGCAALRTWQRVSAVLQQWGGAAVFLCPVLDPLSAWHNPTIPQSHLPPCGFDSPQYRQPAVPKTSSRTKARRSIHKNFTNRLYLYKRGCDNKNLKLETWNSLHCSLHRSLHRSSRAWVPPENQKYIYAFQCGLVNLLVDLQYMYLFVDCTACVCGSLHLHTYFWDSSGVAQSVNALFFST